jgi:hypothetical protein
LPSRDGSDQPPRSDSPSFDGTVLDQTLPIAMKKETSCAWQFDSAELQDVDEPRPLPDIGAKRRIRSRNQG